MHAYCICILLKYVQAMKKEEGPIWLIASLLYEYSRELGRMPYIFLRALHWYSTVCMHF